MFRNLIEKWYVSDFHIDDARVVSDTGYAEHLSKRGDNIAQVTHFLHESHPEAFESVLEAMRRRVGSWTIGANGWRSNKSQLEP